jgi:proteasome lid subunit RPN8/RPN11
MEIDIAKEFNDEIEEIVKSQVQENREAIFFIYDDLTTSKIYQGEARHISLTQSQESRIVSQGEIIGSVHTHPTGFDPSTIDIMTGLATTQKYMSIATPIYQQDIDEDFVLTTIDLSDLNFSERFRMMKAMRRSSVGITDFGRKLRKEANMQRFGVKGYRTHKVKVDGIELPIYERPSVFDLKVGDSTSVESIDGVDMYIE